MEQRIKSNNKMQDIFVKDSSFAFQGNYTDREENLIKPSLKQLSLSSNLNKLNAEKKDELYNNSSKTSRQQAKQHINSNIQHNFLKANQITKKAGINTKINETRIYYSANEAQKDFIKSNYESQSGLEVSLKILRGKSLRKTEVKKNVIGESSLFNNKPNSFDKSKLRSTMFVSQNRENAFSQFFKKPLTFRVSEFKERNQIQNNATFNKQQNKTYAEQRFLGHVELTAPHEAAAAIVTVDDLDPILLPIHSSNSNTTIKNNDSSKSSNLNDDIEKVLLVNNEEELVKKYVLPEIKYLSAQEREKLLNYDVHDNSDKFVIKKSHDVFLSSLLKNEFRSFPAATGNKPLKAKNSEKDFELVNGKVIETDTKFGEFPKFLMKTSAFVKFGKAPAADSTKNLVDFELDSKNITLTKNLFQTKNSRSSVFNLSFNKENNNQNDNYNIEDNEIISRNNIRKRPCIINKNKIYDENQYFSNNPDKKMFIKKNYTSAFNFKTNKIDLSNKAENASIIINFNNTLNIGNINSKNIFTPLYSHFQNSNDNTQKNHFSRYIGSNGYEINKDKYATCNNRKHGRSITLTYPEVKNLIQPYKKITVSRKENPNYLTNGLLIKDPQTIKDIKQANGKTVRNMQNKKENLLKLRMDQITDKLSKIEKRIADIIDTSNIKMNYRQQEYNISSNTNSIITIK